MAETMKHTLIRAYSMDMRRNHGNVVVAEINFRRVSYYPMTKPGQSYNAAGAVLIDASDALESLGTAIARGIGCLVFIYNTDEVLWVPTRADQNITEYWTIEMVPWAEYCRAAAVDDEELIRKAHEE